MHFLMAASFLGYWTYLSYRHPDVHAVFPFIIISFFISALYISGLIGLLPVGRIVLLYAGLGLLTIVIRSVRKNSSVLFGLASKPGIVMLGGLLVFGAIQLRGATFHGWDEFANWGIYGKEMNVNEAFIGPNGSTGTKYYPPGLMLIHYYVASYYGHSEGIIYFAQFASIVSCLGVLFHGARWKAPAALLAVLFAGYFVVQGMEGGFVNLYQDTALSIFFAATVVAYFILRSRHLEYFLIPSLFALPVIKPIGIFFSLTVIAIISLDKTILLLGASRAATASTPSPSSWLRRVLREIRQIRAVRIVVFGALLLAPLIARESWTIRLRLAGISEGEFSTNLLTIDNIEKVFLTSAYEEQLSAFGGAEEQDYFGRVSVKSIRMVRERFLAALFQRPVNFLGRESVYFNEGFHLLMWYALSGVMFVYVVVAGSDSLVRLRFGGLFAMMTGCLLVYIFINIMVYALRLTPFSALILDSYERLMAIYMGAFLLIGFACMILRVEDLPKREWVSSGNGLMALGVATALLILQTPVEDLLFHPLPKLELRKSMEPALQFVQKYVSTSNKIYIVAQKSVGFSYYIMRYELAPRLVEDYPWTFGERMCDRDVWTHDVSALQWTNRLVDGGFDFVLVAHADKDFWDRFRNLFESGTTDEKALFLYRVARGADGSVRLNAVAEAEQRMLPRMLSETNIRAVCRK